MRGWKCPKCGNIMKATLLNCPECFHYLLYIRPIEIIDWDKELLGEKSCSNNCNYPTSYPLGL